jgi:hypothetical protein
MEPHHERMIERLTGLRDGYKRAADQSPRGSKKREVALDRATVAGVCLGIVEECLPISTDVVRAALTAAGLIGAGGVPGGLDARVQGS